MARIAIITPMYNAAGTIGETINSVLAQSLADWEWHLMDDGSTDGTAELAESRLACEPRAQVVRSGRVGHIGTLRNLALRRTTAECVAFLDADDCWEPTFLDAQSKLLDQTAAHVAHSAAVHIADGQIVHWPAKYKGPVVCDPPEMVRQLYPRNPIYSPSVLIRTHVMLDEGGFSEDPDHFSTLDMDLWLRLAPKYRFAYNSQRLLLYRVSQQSLSANHSNNLRNFRGEIRSLEATLHRSYNLPSDLQRLLRHLLNRRESQYARLLLDETPPSLELSRDAFRRACRSGLFVNRYLPFQVLSMCGKYPPFLLYRLLRRLRVLND